MPTPNTGEGIEQVFSVAADILGQIILCWGAGGGVLCIVGSLAASLAENIKTSRISVNSKVVKQSITHQHSEIAHSHKG